MKKLLVATLVLAGLVAHATAAEAPKATALEALVPANTVVFLQAENLPALQKAYEQSALAKVVRESQLLGYLQNVAGAALDFGAVFATGLKPDDFQALLGGHVGAALLDFDRPADVVRQPPVVLLAEAADGPKLEGTIKSQLALFALLSNTPLVAETQHAGTTLYEVAPPNRRRFAFCFQGNVLVLGTRDAVVKLLDAAKAGTPRLGTAPTYQAIASQLALPHGGLRAYVNVKAVMDKAAGAGRPLPPALNIIGVGNVTGMGATIGFAGSKVQERIYIHSAGPSTGVLRFLTEGKPVASTAAQFVPASHTLVGTLALKDVGIWDRLFRVMTDAQGEVAAAQMQAGANMVFQNFGIQIKEGFLDTFTDEIFFSVDLSKLASFLGTGRQPAPQEIPFLFGAKLQNEAALVETLNRIAANERLFEQGIERTVIKHGGADVASFKIPANPEVKPTYAIVDGTLLFSIRPEAVTQAIEARKAKKTLAAALLATPLPQGALPAAGHARLDVDDGTLLRTLVALIGAEAPTEIHRFLPEFERATKNLSGYHASFRREATGYSITTVSDLGTFGTVVIGGLCIDQFNAVVAKRVEGDFAKFAAALKEYHAKHGAYPETLEQLVPDFLPNVVRDRFEPKRPYGYSRGRPDAEGKFPNAWVITSVGPDKKPNIPVEQFDAAAWADYLQSQDPAQIARLKGLLYQFRKDEFPDERKNDDEGDLFRIGGRAAPPAVRPTPPKAPAKTAP